MQELIDKLYGYFDSFSGATKHIKLHYSANIQIGKIVPVGLLKKYEAG
jgi:hypothetical protein